MSPQDGRRVSIVLDIAKLELSNVSSDVRGILEWEQGWEGEGVLSRGAIANPCAGAEGRAVECFGACAGVAYPLPGEEKKQGPSKPLSTTYLADHGPGPGGMR